MLDQIKQLARPVFRPSNDCFQVKRWLGFPAMLDLEHSPPVLHVGSGNSYEPRQPSEAELILILEGLQSESLEGQSWDTFEAE